MYDMTGICIVRSNLVMLEVTVNQLTVLSCIDNPLLECGVYLRLSHNASISAHQLCHLDVGRAVVYTDNHTL